MSSVRTSCLPPKPPPTRPVTTRIRSSFRPKTRPRVRRTRNGTWLEVRTWSRPSSSIEAMAAWVSSAVCATRWVR